MDYRYPRFERRHVMADLGGFRGGPKVGDLFPAFDLPTIDGRRARSDEIIGRRPLVLVTGSYTCPMTKSANPNLERLREEFADQVEFIVLYTRELHPGALYPQADTLERKTAHARALRDRDGLRSTVAVDDIDGALHRALDAHANSAFVVGVDGRVAFRSLWAGGRRSALRRAIVAALAGQRRRQSQGQAIAMTRGMGATWSVLRGAGPGAVRDTLLAMPPAVLVGAAASLFRPLGDLVGGVLGAIVVGAASVGAVALIATRLF